MELTVWNTSLASLAANWAARCHLGHPTGRHYGQNGFARKANALNPIVGIHNWYNEKPGNGGHYTQVVWASSRTIGCAMHRCNPLRGAFNNEGPATWFVCNYWPGGNSGGRPYTKGPSCSKCGSGAGWCKNKLCNTQCSSAGEGCSCAAICYNCAELDLETCRCKCAKGWRGADCSVRCKNRHVLCGRKPGWPKRWCNHPTHKKRIKGLCPAMCGMCEEDPNATEGSCPPVLGPAADSAQTMFIKSHQSTMIFVMIVITFTISSYDAL